MKEGKLDRAMVKSARGRINKTGEVKNSYEDFKAAREIASDRGKVVKAMQDKRKKS